jgi:hypothetical protein
MAAEKTAKPAAETVQGAESKPVAKPEVKDEAPRPVISSDNPEGIDLAAGDKNASPAFEE